MNEFVIDPAYATRKTISVTSPSSIHSDSYVRLGRTELRVSPICFGTWQLSPAFWGDVSQHDVSAALHRAVELGVNFVDTADAYGNGFSEEVLGRTLTDLPRDQIVLATKAYWHFREDGTRYPDLSGEYLMQACEASLKRLNTDYLDLYQCHGFDPLVATDELVAALDKLRQQGKIRHYGTSNWNVHQIEYGLAMGGDFATCQPQYSLVRRDIEQDVLPCCLARDIGVLVYSALHHGLLTGKYRGDESFDDFRAQHADFQGERFKILCQRVAEASVVGERLGLTAVQAMLAATLMHPAIDVAIVGIKRIEQIEEAVGAVGARLSRDEYFQIRSLLDG